MLNCPHCHRPAVAADPSLAGRQLACPYCGGVFNVPVVVQTPPPMPLPVYVPVPAADNGASAMLAALLSFFLPGLGQLCQGRLVAGVLWFLAFVVSVLLCTVLIGFILAPLVWIACIVEAAAYRG